MSTAFAMRTKRYMRYLRRWDRKIHYYAAKLARGEADLEEDLVQVGMIRLWHIDSRSIVGDERAYIRKALFNQMLNFCRDFAGRKLDGLFVRFPTRAT